jgi:hypothetical protein
MTTPKYEKHYKDMIAENAELFDELKKLGKTPNSDEFRGVQFKVLRVIRKNENLLCRKTENTKYSGFSTNLADKFGELIRADYPEVYYSSEE